MAEAALCSDDPVAALVREYETACAGSADPDVMQDIMHRMDSEMERELHWKDGRRER